MNKQAKKLLTIITINLLILGAISPALAAGAEKEENKPVLTPKILKIGFAAALAMTAMAVLLGTGKSMKYNGGEADEAEKDLEKANSHEDDRNVLVDNTDEAKPLNWQDEANSDDDFLVASNGNSNNGNGDKDNGHGNSNGNGYSANNMKVATSEEHLIELQKQLYRQRYQKFQRQVHQSSDFVNSPTKEVDTWEVDVEVALKVLAESPEDRQEVEKILLQSDQVKEWESLLPEPEYKAKAAEYIERAYNWAQDLRKWRQKHISA